jgi:hypothetical protein
MSETRTLEDLEAYKNRLQSDINRSRLMDSNGLDNNSPLIKNYAQVQKDIAAMKESKNV